MTELVLFFEEQKPVFKFKSKRDEMIEFELEKVPQNCKQEDERCEKPKNKQSLITSYFK